MHEGWEIAKAKPRASAKRRRVYVSLNKRGEIAMNDEAFGRIRKPGSVTLLYWAAERCIGVKFPVGLDRNFFLVRRYGRGRKMRIVRGGRLLRQFGLTVERTLVFENPEIVEFRGVPMIVLRLDEGRPLSQAAFISDDRRAIE